MSVSGGYYRNWNNNFLVTDNLAVAPTGYDPYCVTAPSNPQLPGGGGYPVCRLYDIQPAFFGQVNNLVTQDTNYGKQRRVSDFFNASINARVGSGLRIGGGLDTGRTLNDNCFVVDSPQQLLYCRVITPFSAQTQLKLFGSYPLPGRVSLSGVVQSLPGPVILANYPAPNSAIVPSLGRNLAAGTRGTATVPLIQPQTRF